jgi:hypothetical protein
MERIQIVAIIASLSFLGSVLMQIKKGKLREEYAFVWILSTFALIALSFWRNGLDLMGHFFGVYEPLNLIFTGAIFAILIYLLHLSITISRLQLQNRTLAQEIVLLKEQLGNQHTTSTLNERVSSRD